MSMCHVIIMSSRNIAVEMHDLEQYHDGLFVCFPPYYCVFLPSMTTEMASRCSIISLGGCLSSKATLIRRQHEKVCKAYRYAAVVVVGIVAVKVAPAAVVVAAAAVAAAHLLFCDISGGSSSSSSGSNSSSTTSNGSSSSGGSGSSRSR